MRIIIFIIIIFHTFTYAFSNNDNIYDKVDLFGEVLDKVNKEYVEEIDQAEAMDAAIDGVLRSLDPYSAYLSPEDLKQMETETSGKFGGLGIEVGMEAGVVKVISPIDNSPADKAGVKAGDYIVKINDTQVQGKTLTEAVDLMRGPVGSSIEITVRRVGKKKSLIFNITREIIQIASVKSKTYDKKIGFHAPISKMIETKVNLKNFEVKLKYEKLEKLIDIDKLKKNLKMNLFLKKKNYNLYSILNIQEMIN